MAIALDSAILVATVLGWFLFGKLSPAGIVAVTYI